MGVQVLQQVEETMMTAAEAVSKSPISVLDAPWEPKSRPETNHNKRRLLFAAEPCISMNFRHRRVCEQTVAWLADDSSTSCLEELWLGPVFESSQTVLSALSTLPASVTHLDLDLRNALHLLPKAMPILFSKTHLKTLSVRLFGDGGAMEIAKWIHQNPNLEQLDLRGNRIGSEGARAIVDALIQCGHGLSHLNLSCNCILDGDMVARLLERTKLKSLDMSFNWVGNTEVQQICQGLQNNKTLEELNLFGCQRISDIGLRSILVCLQTRNACLRNITIQAYDYRGTQLMDQIDYWLSLNRSGRYLLQEEEDPASGLWPLVLAKKSSNQQPDALFYLLRHGSPRILL